MIRGMEWGIKIQSNGKNAKISGDQGATSWIIRGTTFFQIRMWQCHKADLVEFRGWISCTLITDDITDLLLPQFDNQ